MWTGKTMKSYISRDLKWRPKTDQLLKISSSVRSKSFIEIETSVFLENVTKNTNRGKETKLYVETENHKIIEVNRTHYE